MNHFFFLLLLRTKFFVEFYKIPKKNEEYKYFFTMINFYYYYCSRLVYNLNSFGQFLFRALENYNFLIFTVFNFSHNSHELLQFV